MEKHQSIITPTVEKDSLILVTGASGFIASHVANELLHAGYRVRGTVRSLEKAEWLYTLFDHEYGEGKFEAAVVPDMMSDGAFDEAVKGVSGICHVASVMTFSNKADEVIPTVVKGALNIMTAATKEPGIKSLVITSSSTAALMPVPDKVIKVNKDTWNEESTKQAGSTSDGFTVYGASKTEAERAIWKAVKETNPPFQVSAVLPNSNFGPILKPGGEMESTTASLVIKLYNGDSSVFDMMPPQWFVDVRDDARLHVAALIDPSCNGERIFAFTSPFTWNDILAAFRKIRPGKTFPEDRDGYGKDLSQIPNEDAEALLKKHYGKGFMPLEESIEGNIASLKE